MESWCKSQRVWMKAMSFHAKNMGWIGQIQSFVTGKWIITCVFYASKEKQKQYENIEFFLWRCMKPDLTAVWRQGAIPQKLALQNGAFPAKITLPRPVGGSGERSVCADGQFVRGQNPSRVHGASLYIRRGGRSAWPGCTAPETGGGFPGKQPDFSVFFRKM